METTNTNNHLILQRAVPVGERTGTAYLLAKLLDDMMHTDDPEVVAMFDDAVEEAQEDFKDYVVQAINNSRELESTVEAIDVEIKRLQELKALRVNRAQRLRDAVKRYCEMLGVTEIVTSLFTIKWRKNPPSVIIDDEAIIDAHYKTEKVTITVNKKLIAETLKSGVPVDGAHLHIGTRIEIK